jgi:hypothetical protein
MRPWRPFWSGRLARGGRSVAGAGRSCFCPCEDGFAGGVSAARQATGGGNHPTANPSCWHLAGARGCRGGGICSLRSATMRGSGLYSPAMPARGGDFADSAVGGVVHGLGATPATSVTILSDGADGARSLGERPVLSRVISARLVQSRDAGSPRRTGGHELARRH